MQANKPNEPIVEIQLEDNANFDESLEFLKEKLDEISPRFTKIYLPQIENPLLENFFFIPVEFFERRNKLPVPEHKVVLIFQVRKNKKKEDISFQIENESVSYPLFDSVNLSFFESLIDRVLSDKYKLSKALYLQTNFESTRIVDLAGEQKKLYTIEEDENIFSNNKSEYYRYEGIEFNFKKLEVEDIDRLTKVVWKTLVANKVQKAEEGAPEPTMSFDAFKLLFEYGKLNMSEENMQKLWKYTNKKKNPTITYEEFVNFSIYFIHCINAYSIALYKHENNNCFDNKIKNCVEIMNLHFKEYDTENNEEITFENLKKCLLKENELFTRKEIEVILKQINPEENFQYWKFANILKILYNQYFDYKNLMKEDKIYKYLIKIFSKQDPYKTEKLHYKKMKKALLTEDKIKFDKTEILILLNQFDINNNPEVQYYPASLILRNIVEYLLSSEIGMQKIDITQPKFTTFEKYDDDYDKYCRQVKELFIKYDKDYDHLLSKEEFKEFMKWLVPYLIDEDFEEIFVSMDLDKDGVLNYKEFKNGFSVLMDKTRIKNVIKEIKTII